MQTPSNWDNGFGSNFNLFIGQRWHTNGRSGSTTLNNSSLYSGYRFNFENITGGANQTFTVQGSAITLFDFGGSSPGIFNLSNINQIFNAPLVFNPGNTGVSLIQVNGAAGGNLNFGGTVSLDTNGTGNQLRISGANANTVTFGNVISATGGSSVVVSQGSSNLTVVYNAANTYNGDTFVDSGTLQFGTDLSSAGSADSSILRLGQNSANSPTASINLATTAGGVNVGSTIVVRPSSTGSQGTRTLSSSNTSGTNTFSGAIALDAAATFTETNSGGTLAFTGATLELKTFGLTVNGAGDLSISSAITSTGAGNSLSKSGTGTLILSSTSNSYTGGTAVTNGTLQTAVATNGFGSTSGISIGGSGTLALRSDSTTAFGNGTTAYPVALTASGATINVDKVSTGGGNITLGTVSMPGNYTLNLTGANNTSLTLGAVVGSTNNNTIANAISGGGSLILASYAQTDASARTVTFSGAGNTTVSGAISQNGTNALAVTYGGTGKLILNGTNGYTGATLVSGSGGILQFGSAAAIGGTGRTVTVQTGSIAATSYAMDQAFLNRFVAGSANAGVVALGANSPNSLDFTAITSGALSLGSIGAFTYSGATLTPVGTVYRLGGGGGDLTVSTALSTATNTLTVAGSTAGGGRVILTSGSNAFGTITMNPGSILQANDSTAYVGNTNVANVLGASAVISPSGTTTLELRSNGQNDAIAQTLTYVKAYQVSNGGQTTTIDVDRQGGTGTNKTLALGAINSGVAAAGTTTWNVTGANGYSLQFASLALGTAGTTGTVLLNPTSANLAIAGNVTNSGGSALTKTLNLGGTSTGNRILGSIADGSGGAVTALLKSNTSTWTLNGANTYGGGTTINGGKLIVGNTTASSSATGSGSVTVNNSGTLMGGNAGATQGFINAAANAITVNAGGTIAPGTTSGSVGSLTLAASSVIFTGTDNANLATLSIDLVGNNIDLLKMTGGLDLSSSFDQIAFTQSGTQSNSSFTLATYTGSRSGIFDSVTGLTGYSLDYSTIGEVRLVAVPEPSTWVAGFLTIGALGFKERRRLRKLAGL